LTLPALRNEWPGWGRLARPFGIIGAENDSRWRGAPRKRVRGKWHRYWMELNLADWSERQTWFLARYGELAVQLLMTHCLRPGDRAADIGANIGMVTLHAAALVGPSGSLDSFEPNPGCADRIEHALRENGIKHVRLHRMGLSDSPATLTLNVLLNHTGMGTLAPLGPSDQCRVTHSVSVPVEVGDAILLKDDRPITLIKVDVEGFETRVLKGLHQTLQKWRPIVLTEVIPEWLERAGSSVIEMLQTMNQMGYIGYGLSTYRRNLRHRLRLCPLPPQEIPKSFTDVVWIANEGTARQRLADVEMVQIGPGAVTLNLSSGRES
jgi:FkbM family methyltransferase